jgi:DNA replication licensing factor MCM3
LSTAHAKARLSTKIQEKDAQVAEAILQYALFKEVLRRPKRKKRKLNNSASGNAVIDGSEESDEDSEEEEEPAVNGATAATAPQMQIPKDKPPGWGFGSEVDVPVDDSQNINGTHAHVRPQR